MFIITLTLTTNIDKDKKFNDKDSLTKMYFNKYINNF